jgi:SH3-like domain-containing protein
MLRALPVLALSLVLAACASPAAVPATHPSTTASATPSASPLPASIWVNAPLGVNLRNEPDPNAARLEALLQGAKADVIGRRDLTDGSSWFQVKAADGQQGWVSAAYVVTSAILRAWSTTDGWSLMLPATFSTRTVASPSPGAFTAGPSADSAPPFVKVQAAASLAALPPATPAGSTFDHSRLMDVWNYTVQEKIYRTPEGLFLAVVRVPAPNRAYQFLFWTADNDAPIVTQILASIALS